MQREAMGFDGASAGPGLPQAEGSDRGSPDTDPMERSAVVNWWSRMAGLGVAGGWTARIAGSPPDRTPCDLSAVG